MLSVKYKGRTYENFDSIDVTTSIDDMCGTFSFKTTLNPDLPFGKGSFISVYSNGKPLCSGFIEKVSGSISEGDASVTFSGRDLLGDLVDSSVVGTASQVEGAIALPELCRRYLDALGIKAQVENLAGTIEPFDKQDITAVEFGAKAGETLQSFARKRQLFITSFGDGRLYIFKPPTKVSYPKLTVDDLLDRTFSFDDTNRFYKIDIGSEDNASAKDTGIIDAVLNLASGVSDSTEQANPISRVSSVFDKSIRKTRYLQVTAEESMSDEELKQKAYEESDVRRTDGFSYSVTVPTHIYRTGTLISIEDKQAGVSGVFLIKSISYSTSDSGNTSNLTLCYPESYQAVKDRTSENKSKMADSGSNESANLVKAPIENIIYPESVRAIFDA